VRVGADWCTLCYTDLRPAPPAPEAVVPEAVAVPPSVAQGPAAVDPASPVRGRHARRAPASSAPALDADARTADAMLAQLAAAESANPLGRAAGSLDSPAKKVALMIGGAVSVTALLFLLMVVVGALL
jgi:hypothetical protein